MSANFSVQVFLMHPVVRHLQRRFRITRRVGRPKQCRSRRCTSTRSCPRARRWLDGYVASVRVDSAGSHLAGDVFDVEGHQPGQSNNLSARPIPSSIARVLLVMSGSLATMVDARSAQQSLRSPVIPEDPEKGECEEAGENRLRRWRLSVGHNACRRLLAQTSRGACSTTDNSSKGGAGSATADLKIGSCSVGSRSSLACSFGFSSSEPTRSQS